MQKTIFTPDYRAMLARLKEARRLAGYTQAQLAERVGETQSFVSKVERGERRLDVVEMRDYCRALGIPLAEVLP